MITICQKFFRKMFITFMILILLSITGCFGYLIHGFSIKAVSLEESKIRFIERGEYLKEHFGSENVWISEILQNRLPKVEVEGIVKANNTEFEIYMLNPKMAESYEIYFSTTKAASPQLSLPDEKSLLTAAKIVELLSCGEYSQSKIMKCFTDAAAKRIIELQDPDYFEKKAAEDARFVLYDYEFGSRAANGFSYDIKTDEDGMYHTEVIIGFSGLK